MRQTWIEKLYFEELLLRGADKKTDSNKEGTKKSD